MTKKWFSRLPLIALIGAAISTTSCSSDDDKDSGGWITPNNADVTVLYYSNGGGDLDAITEWDLVGAAYELCTDTRNVRLFVQHKYTGQKAYDFEQLLAAIVEGPKPVDPEERKSLILKFWGPKPVDYDFSNYLHL